MTIIDIDNQNKVNLIKLLWNVIGKADNTWIKWIHYYYVKNQNIMTMAAKNNTYWILKAILKMRSIVSNVPVWSTVFQANKYQTRKIYVGLADNPQDVNWRKIFYNSAARPRYLFILWMACHERLATKNILVRFSMLVDDKCCFCRERETITHLFFQCKELSMIEKYIMD